MHCPYEEQDFLVGVAEALAVAVAPEGVLAASVCCLSIDLFQLFFDVITKTRPGTKVTFLLPHFGHWVSRMLGDGLGSLEGFSAFLATVLISRHGLTSS
jgi:hypothetical protein